MFLPPEPTSFTYVGKGTVGAFIASLPLDRRLAAAEVAGTLAHVAVLQAGGILSRQESRRVAGAVRSCLEEIESGAFPWDPSLEDVHTNLEARVIHLAGTAGEKIHAGRSRNEQVALDERLYLRGAVEAILVKIAGLEAALLEQARAASGVLVPSYTHLQRAQPIVLGHAFLAHLWRLARDVERLHDAFTRVNVCPVGAGAAAGSSLSLDPSVGAKLLGFDRVFSNSLDATSDRDYFVEVTSDLALLAIHLSQLCEDLVLYSTKEFGFLALADAHLTGSSLLPNKRNPDVLELIRGQAGSVTGDLVTLLTLLKGLPLGYNRDLQADKGPAFHAFDTVSSALDVLAEVVSGLRIQADACGRAVEAEASAVLLVEYLVARGVPYREAYELVKIHLPAIAAAPDAGARLTCLRAASRLFDESAVSLLDAPASVAAIASHGGTGPAQVAAQIEEAEATLGKQSYHLNLIAKKNRRIADVLSGEAGP